MIEGRDTFVAPTPGWQLIQTFYLLLGSVSAVGFIAPPLDTREGRWGVGLALANLTLVLLGTAITWFAYRQRQRWAWWVVLATGLCYGLPMTLIDHLQVGWLGRGRFRFSSSSCWHCGPQVSYWLQERCLEEIVGWTTTN